MKKILHVVAVKPKGGVGSFLMNIYEENMNYHFDIVESGKKIEGNFDNFFIDRGSNIFLFPEIKYKNILKYYFKCEEFYKNNSNNYSAIHVHATSIAFFHLYFAKKYGIKTRIFHAHGNLNNINFLKKYINKYLLKKIHMYSTNFLSCSKKIGEKMFGKRKFFVIPNGIDTNKYKFNIFKRNMLREKFNLQNKKVVGIVGRFDENKNQKFVLELANKLKSNNNLHFLFIGNGETFIKCKEICKDYKLSNITFLDFVLNVNDYYNAMDVLILPSKNEGFSLVAIEAQCNGLNILFSDTLDKEMKLIKGSKFIATDIDLFDIWETYIKKDYDYEYRISAIDSVAENYSVNVSRSKLNFIYSKII